ncbi:hypothetical protein B0T21DRAFT_280609 [Apiosordaria backusii]|uniref:Lytic polysaccharide monooxygenase n=1 Tax=Apiosordaria backusii TaxID=314023 RepID=A0AA40K3P8_9PEZI|nr:hypothetical protein B0T21DRAFT_280609 [Apiosordaria backusii]
MYSAAFLATALTAQAVSAHLIMNTPTPYNYHGTSPLVQVDPLGALPFPCQGNTDVVEVTSMQAGTEQLVQFTGGAQHGGGSCQFSVTYDFPPPADKSKWKTIYTLIGGCPVSAAGNLPAAQPDQDGRADSPQCGNDSGVECVRQFNVPIPKNMPNGNATFAWTWYNKIGNREVYMNCAPVQISGGSDDTAFFDSLPQMFVANIPGECTTNNGVLNIPNPGRFGKVLEQPAPNSEGTCEKAAGIPSFEGDTGAAPAPTQGQSSTLITSTRSSSPSSEQPIITATPTPSETPVVVVPTGNPSVVIPDLTGVPCSPDGSLFCFSPLEFGICNGGIATPQPVAPGTTCSFGTPVNKRSVKYVSKVVVLGPRQITAITPIEDKPTKISAITPIDDKPTKISAITPIDEPTKLTTIIPIEPTSRLTTIIPIDPTTELPSRGGSLPTPAPVPAPAPAPVKGTPCNKVGSFCFCKVAGKVIPQLVPMGAICT